MTYIDQVGYAVTAASGESVERYDAALGQLVLFADGVGDAWENTVADDPGFALGHVGRAYIRCLSSERGDAAEAAKILEELGDGTGLNDRERRHVGAARAYATGDLRAASEQLAALSVEYPLDALALVVGHQLDFFQGDALTLRDRVGRTLLAWDKAHPLYGFVLGMQAFGLEECGLYPQAEATALAALELNQRDVWALHAGAHVLEMQSRVEDGIRFMDERRADWTTGNFFVVHNSWHDALFRLELGDTDAALRIYDATLHNDSSSKVALEMLDATALLWRIHLDGGDVGGRWAPLADAWIEKADEPWYVFNDAHAAMALVGAGRTDEAKVLADQQRAFAAAPHAGVTNVIMTAEVGIPVIDAVIAFGEARYNDVVSLLHPIRTFVQRFGGSHAQRDAVARTLLEAAIRAGDHALANALVSERLAVRESNLYGLRQLSRIQAAATAPDATLSTATDHTAARKS